ncbi:PKD domain-containing protein [Rubrivirga sp.]|uniref:PKD domain-containing protein n=1 Tax=Rubrivirga sp. TaxID=1885344 RepID=UPI003B52FA48
MTLSTAEKPTTRRLSSLLPWCAAFLVAASAQAQVVRPSNSVYVLLRGAVAGYNGDLDLNSDADPTEAEIQPLRGFEEPGFGVSAEIGYLFNRNLSFGIAGWYQDLPNLGDRQVSIRGVPIINNVEGGEAYQLQALFRILPFASARISPFIELGGALVSGQGTEDERGGTGDGDVLGYGPVGGLGLDIALTPQLGIFLGAQSTVVFPDVALDGADPSVFNVEGDDAEYDIITNLGGGLRFAFKAPGTAVEIEGLECPAELETGEAGSFMVMTNVDATAPVTTTWQWGDGASSSGMTMSHSFSAPGTYTVSAMVMNDFGDDTETCLVTVVEPPTPPSLAGCRATPSSANVGDSFTVDATVTDADEVTVDFGDGTTASALPARHAYAETGSYTVTITATNEYGTDTCTIPVTVGDAYCAGVAELNPVFFGYGATTLTADATGRLDENVEILRRCPDVCVTVNGYSDGSEPGDALRVSQARADAVVQYYVGQGIAADRLRAVGRGVDPDANSKEDPGPGDSRARRADSIPSSCAGF